MKLTDKIHRKQSKFEIDTAEIRQVHEPKPMKKTNRLLDDSRNVDLSEYLKGSVANMHL